MSFCWVTLQVKNLEDSLSFYHDTLGLPVNSRHSGNGIEMVMLGEEKQPLIELLCNKHAVKESFQSDISVGIKVKNLEDTIEYLKSKQISVLRGPIEPAPGTRFLFIQDPDGYEVQLVEML